MVLVEVPTSRGDVSGKLSGERGRPTRSRFVLCRVHDSFQGGTAVLVEAPKTCQHYFQKF
jgi:hypothetical protein